MLHTFLSIAKSLTFGSTSARRATTVALRLDALGERIVPATYVWTGADSVDWTDKNNWLVGANIPQSAPGSADNLVFDGTCINNNRRIIVFDDAATFEGIKIADVTGNFKYELTFSNGLELTGNSPSEFNSGILSVGKEMELGSSDGGAFTWKGGMLVASFKILSGAQLILDGGNKELYGGISIEGSAEWKNGNLDVHWPDGIRVESSGTFTVELVSSSKIGIGLNSGFKNFGTFNVASESNSYQFVLEGYFENHATMQINNTIGNYSNFKNFGTIAIAGDARMVVGIDHGWITNGPLVCRNVYFDSGPTGVSRTTGTGEICFAGETLNIAGTVDLQSEVTDCSSELKGAGDLNILGKYSLHGGPYNRPFTWEAVWSGTGKVRVGSSSNNNAELSLHTDKFSLNRSLTSYAKIKWHDFTYVISPTITIGSSAALRLEDGSIFDIRARPTGVNARILGAQANPGSIRNEGTIMADTWGSDGKVNFDIEYKQHNNGKIKVLPDSKMYLKGVKQVFGGKIDIEPRAVFVIEDGLYQEGGEFTNNGNVTLTGGYNLAGGSVLTEKTTDAVTFSADSINQTGGSMAASGADLSFTVTGAYTYDAGSTSASIVPDWTENPAVNIGSLLVNEEHFTLGGNGVVTEGIAITDDGQLLAYDGAELATDVDNDGTFGLADGVVIDGAVTNSGLVHIGHPGQATAGELAQVDSFTQSSTGTFRAEVTDGSEDLLTVTNTASVAGTLHAQLANGGTTPLLSELIDYGTRMGTFATLIPPAAMNYNTWYDFPVMNALGIELGPDGRIGDKVWYDANSNGIQDSTEGGQSGVTVNLRDSMGALVATTTTDVAGEYWFVDLEAGDYQVEVVAPMGYSFGPKDQGTDDALDSDVTVATGYTEIFTLVANEYRTDIDAALVTSSGGSTGSIGDYVWLDTDGDGVQDAGETGYSGMTVNLLDSNSNMMSFTATVDGFYWFSGLAPGTYYVEFMLPSGYSFSPANQGGDPTADSDANPTTGITNMIMLLPGGSTTHYDVGLVTSGGGGGPGGGGPGGPIGGSIGNYVWVDTDEDGIQDTNESGLGGVTVRLLDAYGLVLATTTTNAAGFYLFSSLAAGSYQVEFVAMSGYAFTLQDQGSDDEADSDADTSTGRTALITLGASEFRNDLDAGFFLDE